MRKTMFIGLGGFGTRVVAKLKKYAAQLQENEDKIYAVAVDSDDFDLNRIAVANNIPQVSLGAGRLVRELLQQYRGLGVDEWFPASQMLLHSETYSTGVRAVGRLNFLNAKESGRLEQLREMLEAFMVDQQDAPRIVVVTSLVGGAGSGMFIQLAVWLRNLMRAQWNVNPQICGMFAGPEMFIRTQNPSISQCERFRANAYSALRELEMFTEIVGTGNAPAGYPDFFLDGINLARNGPMPIYDHISLYEPAEESQDTFETHLDRIAGSAWLWLQADPAMVTVGQIRESGLHFMALGAAVAQYPKKEVLEYCSIRGALELVSDGWKKEQLTVDQVEHQVAQMIRQIEAEVESALESKDSILDLRTLLEEQPSAEQEIEAHVHRLTQNLEIRIKDHKKNYEELRHGLSRQISHALSLERWSTLRSMLTIGDGEEKQLWSPATLKKVLQKLLLEMNTLQETQSAMLEAQEKEPAWYLRQPLPSMLRNVKVEENPSYPEMLWYKIPPVRKILMGSRVRKEYLGWLHSSCKEALQHQRQMAKTALFGFLLGMLCEECKELLRVSRLLWEELEGSLHQLRSRNAAQGGGPVTIRLCADTEGKEWLYRGLQPYVSKVNGHEIYLQMVLGIYAEQKWPHLTENAEVGNQIRMACKELLQQFRNALVNNDERTLHMEAAEALCHAGQGTAPLDLLCRQLRQKAQENGGHMLSVTPVEGESQEAVFYISRACDYRAEVDNILRNMHSTYMETHAINPALMWCMALRWNIPLERTPMASWAEAYRWLCQRAKNSGEEHFTPHMDKQWAEKIFGLQ